MPEAGAGDGDPAPGDRFDLLCRGDVWDAAGGRRTDRWLGVRDGRVVGEYESRPGDADQVVEARLFTPGLVDMHVHLVWDGSADPVATLRAESTQERTVRAVGNARATLAAGVTTVRDLGSPGDVAVTVGRAVRAGWIPGPRTVASGRTVIITAGHDPFWGIESDGPPACRRAVRELRGAGAEVIKVSATGGVYGQAVGEDPGAAELSLEELEAVVDEAARFDLSVAAHAVGTDGIANAVAAGVDTIEHGNLMADGTLDRLVETDVAYDPTLFVYREIAEGDAPAYAKANASRVVERHWGVFAQALDAGARVLAGSDAGSPGTPHPSLHRELACLVEGGMDESAALTAATETAADELGRPGLGTLDAGTPADLVGWREDPLADIEATADPAVVVSDGAVVQ